jgi:hypothetical protein
MHLSLIPHRLILALVVAAVLLPITLCVVLGVASLLDAMGDSLGGLVLRRIALAGGILWGIDGICLVMVLAIGALCGPDEPDAPQSQIPENKNPS